MSFLREMGLAAALLAATGGAAIATWSYLSAQRRKDGAHVPPTGAPSVIDCMAEQCEEGAETPEQPQTTQGDRRSQTGAPEVEGDRGSQTGASEVEGERRSQTGASAVQVEGERRSQPGASAVQVEGERSQPGASAVQVEGDRRSQPGASAVQVEGDRRSQLGASAVQVEGERRSQPGASAVQVEGERSDNANTVQGDRSLPDTSALQIERSVKVHDEDRSHPDTSSVESSVIQQHSDSSICTEIHHQVKASLNTQVVVLGLDGSGKTSVLNSISANKGKLVTTPTAGVNAMCVSNRTSKMEFLEIGGSEHLRPYWKMYLSRAFAVIFVVDSADHGRLPLAKRHLHQLIQQDAIIPLIVLANKQDLKNAYHITEIHEALGLSDICEKRKLFLIGTYVTKDDTDVSSGILDAKEFLAQLLSENSAIIS